MTRLPRFVIPDQPQHVILRGNNRAETFCAEADYSQVVFLPTIHIINLFLVGRKALATLPDCSERALPR